MSKAIINAKRGKGTISKYIYGQFAEHLGRCIYEGLYVEDDSIENKNGMRCDVVNALRELEIPVLRWPGGCFADDYHWRDGIGEKDKRPYMVNTNWGKVVENNHFGTHEFFELCEQLGTEPYICGNVGSGSVKEMRDWVEYMTFGGDSPLANERRANGREEPWKLKYFGVGNENWGCGGDMRPEYYSDLYRRFAVFIRDYGDEPLYKVACGANKDDYNWTEVVMNNVGTKMNAISLHNYQFENDWQHKGDSIDFTEDGYYTLLSDVVMMKEIIESHIAVMDKCDPEKKIALIVDEWGNWFDVMPGTNPGFLYQQNTIRDAISAMMMLHTFHDHCDRVHMANIAQMVNVLQAMVLTEGDKMVLTPTYYVFKMMKPHMGAENVDVDLTTTSKEVKGKEIPNVSVSASRKDDALTISVCNTSASDSEEVELEIRDMDASSVTGEIMSADKMNAYNDFGEEERVHPVSLDARIENGVIRLTLPKLSVAVLSVK